jgi:uncharacterized protein (DUF697 family)
MPQWADFGGVWNTLREIDISAIRAEAERPLAIALIGLRSATDSVAMLLRQGAERFPPIGLDPLTLYAPPLTPQDEAELRRADLILIALEHTHPLTSSERRDLERAAGTGLPTVLVQLGQASDQRPLPTLRLPRANLVQIADPQLPPAALALAATLVPLLPDSMVVAAARRLPGLRTYAARHLINQTAMANATYALATGVPEIVPVLAVPFAAADIVIITKNQAIMTYKLALALGAPPDFQARIKEVLPVVGGAFLWRQLARTLVSLVPVWGLIPKIAIAYAGTYATGSAAWAWYARGDLVSREELRRLSAEGMRLGREQAQKLLEAAQKQTSEAASGAENTWGRLRRRLPFAKPRTGEEPPLPPADAVPSDPADPPG